MKKDLLRKKNVLFLFCCIASLFGTGNAFAQLSISTPGAPVSQNFNTLPNTGTALAQSGGIFSSGWSFIETGTSGNTTYDAGTGSGTAGNTYSFGVAGNTDRSLGSLRSGAAATTLGFYIKNTTGGTVSAIQITYTGKTFRVGAANRSDRYDFGFSLDATSLTTGSFTEVDALDYANPGQATNTPTGTPAHSAVISSTISGLNIANNATVFFRWVDFDATGADDGMGIDDFSITLLQPSFSVSPTALSGFSTTSGVASDPQAFTITGTNLLLTANNLVVTAPTGYEVSENGIGVYGDGVAFTPTAGPYSKIIQVRIKSAAASGAANGDVTISAAAVTPKTVTLTGNVTAASFPNLSLSGATAFGTSCLNSAATPIQYTISNTGSVAANGVAVSLTDPQFAVTTPLSSTTIAANGTATFTVTFTPTVAGAQSSTLNVTSTTTGTTFTSIPATLTGTGNATVAGAVTTNAATAVTGTTAILNGNLTAVGVCPATTEKGFVYALTSANSDPLNGGTGVTTTAVATVATGAYTLPLSALTTNTGYTFKSYVFDGTAYTYGTAQSFTTFAAAPVAIATNFTFTPFTTNSIHVAFTNGDGERRIVVARLSATTAIAPTNGLAYTAISSSFTDPLNGTTGPGNVVVYEGTGSDVDVTGLTAGTAYRFDVYEYNGAGSAISYGNAASGAKSTLAVEPTVQASNVTFSAVSATGFTVNWTLGNGDNSLVVIKDGSASDVLPVDGISYNAGSNIFGAGTDLGSGNFAVYRATLGTIAVTGLTEGHTYNVAVYTYGGAAGSGLENYLTTTPATGSKTATTPTYYSKGSLAPNVLANWSTTTDGTGPSPASFTSAAKFIIQTTHNMTTTATWTFGASGSVLEVQDGATLTAANTITVNAAATFKIDNGGSYIQNVAMATGSTIFQGTEVFGATSNVAFRVAGTTFVAPSLPGYGNLTINLTSGSTGAVGLTGAIKDVQGDLNILATNTANYRFSNTDLTVTIGGNFNVSGGDLTLAQSTGNVTVNVAGNFTVSGGTLKLSAGAGNGVLNVSGDVSLTGGGVTKTAAATGSKIVFAGAGATQNFTSGATITDAVNYEVSPTAVANLGTAAVTGAGKVTVLGGGKLYLASTDPTGAIAGNIPATGGLVLNANSGLYFTSADAQYIAGRADYSALILANNGNKTFLGDATVETLQVINAAKAIVPTGKDVTVTTLIVDPTAAVTIENDANLLQNSAANNNPNIGSINVKRDAKMWRQDYVYWGAPVSGQNLKDFSPATLEARFYVLKEDDNTFQAVFTPTGLSQNPLTYNFVPAKGYMVRAPNTFPNPTASGAAPTTTFPGSFTGLPNSGDVSIATPATASQFHMIANPYPSALSGTSFLASNPGTLYFWSHHDQTSGNAVNYATFNLTGGTAAPDYAGAITPDGSIAVGQGFMFLNQSANTSATFTNAMRTGNNTALFYREGVAKSRIWINLKKDGTRLNQALVAYIPSTTTGFDAGYDGKLIEGGSAISSLIGTDKYAIQARAAFDTTDVVPMHFFADAAGNYSLSIAEVDGIFADGQDIFLKDNLLNNVTDLKANAYNFTSEAGSFANRFEVVYQASPLANPVFDSNKVVIFKTNNVFNINSGNSEMAKVQVFDIRGSLIYSKENINATTTTLNDLKAAQGVLLVQITSKGGIVVTRKVVN